MLRSSSCYPVGPVVSDSSTRAKKALEFKAFVVSVSARVWLKPELCCRVWLRRARIIMRRHRQCRSAELLCQALLETAGVERMCRVSEGALASRG